MAVAGVAAIAVGAVLARPRGTVVEPRDRGLSAKRVAGLPVPARPQIFGGAPSAPVKAAIGDSDDAWLDALPPEIRRQAMRCSPGGRVPCGDCASDTDCPAENACLLDPQRHRKVCLPSMCKADVDCEPSTVCRTVNITLSAPGVRRCVPLGTEPAGQPCRLNPAEATESCSAGLLCVLGICGASCRPDGPACPSGGRCLSTDDGWGCSPSCEGTTCPDGQSCIPVGGPGVSICARQIGKRCEDSPCAAGEVCMSETNREHATVAFICRKKCSAFEPKSCPVGQVCGRAGRGSVCYRACDPQGHDCPASEECMTVNEEQTLWGCRP